MAMSRKVRLLLTVMASVTQCAAILPAAAQSAPSSSHPTSSPAPTSDKAVRAQADALLARMTPQEKAGQLAIAFYLPFPQLITKTDKDIASGSLGSALFVTDPATVNRLQHVAMTQSRLKIPLLFGFDVIHGLHTIMPVPLALAASWDPAMVVQAQSVAASEARAVGIDWVFAPNVDIARDPRWGRLVEGAGEDPYLGSAMAAAQVTGFQGDYIGSPGHVIAGPKHFAGYGASLGGRDYDESAISDDQLWNVYLPPFKAAIEAGAGNIMSAYMPLNGVPAAGNSWLLTEVLRKTWGFKGFVVSDSDAVHSMVSQGFSANSQDAAARALTSGIDVEMAGPGKTPAMAKIPELLATGRVSARAVDNAVRRVLEAKIRMGLFDHPYVDESKVAQVLSDPDHRKVARIAAERSAVLLRNEGSLLPLDRKAIRSIALIGPLADTERDMLGSWVFPQNKPVSVSVLAGLRAKLGAFVRIDTSVGVRLPQRINPSPMANLDPPPPSTPLDESSEIARAVNMAKNADVAILALGEGQNMSGETASRSSLDLPGRQQELLDAVIATGKPVVVLLFSARPLDLRNAKPAAVLDMWYPGSEGGNAVANLLMGDATPGGKLPFNWVAGIGQIPNPYAHLLSHDNEKADKRYWNEASSKPTYPFGHGLSYTSFTYTNLHVDKPAYKIGSPVTVSVDLANGGTRAGDEVAQLYIHQRSGTSARPVRELKGFQRVTLMPGEKRTLRFTIRPEDLRYWSAVTRGMVADASTFDVWVGTDSNATLAANFTVTKN